jgi:hypothetical protein
MLTVQVAISQLFSMNSHMNLFNHQLSTSWYISIDIIFAFYRSWLQLIDIIMNYHDITNKISRLVDETHEWSPTILLPDGDKCIDISSAAMDTASVTLANATKQPDVYLKGRAASVYCFDLDINNENSWMKLKSTLTQVGCVSGCRLVLRYTDQRQTLHWKACYKLWCSCRLLFQNNGSSNYLSDNVGPSNVVTEHLKHVKTFGVLKGKVIYILCYFG